MILCICLCGFISIVKHSIILRLASGIVHSTKLHGELSTLYTLYMETFFSPTVQTIPQVRCVIFYLTLLQLIDI